VFIVTNLAQFRTLMPSQANSYFGNNILDAHCLSEGQCAMPTWIINFGYFCWAVIQQYFVLAAGCAFTVMIALLERHVFKRQISYKLEVGVLFLFIFIACFRAWDIEYSKGKTDNRPSVVINVPQQPPPQVQVNAPATGAGPRPEGAYLSSIQIVIFTEEYRIGGHWAIKDTCKNLSNSVVARDRVCMISLQIVDTTTNQFNQAIVSREVEDHAYHTYLAALPKVMRNITRKAFGPGESSWNTAASAETIDTSLDASFREAKKTIILIGEYDWTDDRGTNKNELCEWLQMYPQFFTGPGKMAPDPIVSFHYCSHHNGLVTQ
jgi:hypothetical protein